jgi:hypothetical protein
MGIPLHLVDLLTKALVGEHDLPTRNLLTLGVQDCHFGYEELRRFLDRRGVNGVRLGPDEIEYTSGFKWLPAKEAARFAACVHQNSLFRMLGFSAERIHALDVSPFEGSDIIHDLNEPVDPDLQGAFDFIIDSGTIEHVFSTKETLFNLATMCAVGGCVVLYTPSDSINHGFINVNAELYRDFFTANGFQELFLKYVAVPTNPWAARRHYLMYPPERLGASLRPFYSTAVFAMYRKDQETRLRVPQQGLYNRIWRDGAPERTRGRLSSAARLLPSAVREWLGGSILYTGLMISRGERVRLA